MYSRYVKLRSAHVFKLHFDFQTCQTTTQAMNTTLRQLFFYDDGH